MSRTKALAVAATIVLLLAFCVLVLSPREEVQSSVQEVNTARPPVTVPPQPRLASPAGETAGIRFSARTGRPARAPCISFGTVSWEDGPPVEGAEIYLYAIDSAYEGELGIKPRSWIPSGIVTDSAGSFRLPEQDVCPLRLGALLDGEGWAEEWDRPVPKGTLPEFEFERNLLMRSASGVSGRVVAPSGEPVSDAVVSAAISWTLDEEVLRGASREERTSQWWEIALRGWAHQTTTGSDGTFRFPALTKEDWTFVGEADGFSFGQSDVDREELGSTVVIIRLERIDCWNVHVVDERGNPVPSAEVAAKPRVAATDRRWEVLTNDEGVAEICEVDPVGASHPCSDKPRWNHLST